MQIIPENITGKALDIEHNVEEINIETAIKTFKRGQARLVNPPVWHLLTGALSAKFALHSSDDEDNRRLARVDDYFAIDIPGPGRIEGDGFDWVKVETLQQNTEPGCDESIAMRLRASKDPSTGDPAVAHFFKGQATSTFIIKRIGQKVFASYHGRNEEANTDDLSLMDKIRNKLVATGAEAGFSNLQWEALIKGFLEPEIGG